MVETVWNEQYKKTGVFAQRLYPNEALLCFLGGSEHLFGKDKHPKILELGCGSGANLWMMAKEGFEVSGIDISPEGIEIAKNHLYGKWGVHAKELKVGSFTNIPFEDGLFDYVVDIVSMQHIDLNDSRIALKEVNRVLKKKGKFFSYRLSDHSAMYLSGGGQRIDAVTLDNISDDSMPLNNNKTISFWSPERVVEEYTNADFSVEEIERYTRTYNNGLISVEYLAITGVKE